MVNCKNCGNENRPEARFCRSCGQSLHEQTETPTLEAANQLESIDLPEIPFADEPFLEADSFAAAAAPPQDDLLPEIEEPALESEGHSLPDDEITQVSGGLPESAVDAQDGSSIEETTPALNSESAAAFDQEDETTLFGVLPAGVLLNSRYRILGLVEESNGGSVYTAEDLLVCWSCGADQPGLDEQYCLACGAELLPKVACRLRVVDRAEAADPDRRWFEEAGIVYLVEAEPREALLPVERPRLLRLTAGSRTDPGQEREINEDSLLVLNLAGVCESASAPALGFYAVADGIGGNDAGEIASRVAIKRLAAELMQRVFLPAISQPSEMLPDWGEQLREAALSANQEILKLRSQAERETNMGCTLTAALVDDSQAFVVNAGDSRTYRMRAGRLEQVTRDHSIVARLVEQGYLASDDIYTHEQKSVIYRSLGDRSDLEIEVFHLELEPGDRLLLCSDGLWEMVRNPLIEEVLLERYDPQQACDRLVEMANLNGGEDNISVIVVNFEVLS